MDVTAAVTDEVGACFTLQEVALGAPGANEVVVEIAGVGLCQTDLGIRDGHLPFPLPGVLGHEGSGVVARVGTGVTKVSLGDKVVLTFDSCGECAPCHANDPAYCANAMSYNLSGARQDGSSTLSRDGKPLGSSFFGQSSFATHAIARERNVVKIGNDVPVALAGPLGCGVQTGAGAVMNSLDCVPGSTLLVLGGGSVGLSAVLAAVVRDVGTIIVVEPHGQRRDLALSLGATHVVDPVSEPLLQRMKEITPRGIDYALDTAAVADVLQETMPALAHRAKVGIVGLPSDHDATLRLNLTQVLAQGIRVMGILEGDSEPDLFIPYLLDLHRGGRFPFDRLITTMPFSQINEAVAAQLRGEVVKIVLVQE